MFGDHEEDKNMSKRGCLGESSSHWQYDGISFGIGMPGGNGKACMVDDRAAGVECFTIHARDAVDLQYWSHRHPGPFSEIVSHSFVAGLHFIANCSFTFD